MEEGRPRILVKRHHEPLTSEQRAGFALVAVMGFCALIIGSFYMIRTLHKPFDISYEGPLFLSSSEKRALEVEAQKTRDTDGDGLTDYEELYVYRTSPYLRDTDGDGVTDDVAVRMDQGQGTSVTTGGAQTNEFLDAFGNAFTDSFGSSFYTPSPSVDSLNTAVSGGGIEDLENVSPDMLREMLRAQGATEDQLRYVTDQQLLQRYLEVLEQHKQAQEEEATQSSGGSQGTQ